MNKLKKTSEPTDPYEKNLQNFEWALNLNRLSLRLIGVWPGDEDVAGVAGLAVYLRVPFMVFFMFGSLFLPQMYALTLVYKELPLVIDNLMSSSATLLSCIKLFFIWRSKKVLRPVIQSLTEDWLCVKHDWEIKVMKKEATRARIFTVSGYAFVLCVYLGFAFPPLFGLNVHPFSNITSNSDRQMVIQSYYPYDYLKSPNYEITQVSQLIAGVFITFSISIPENYFAALVFHASAQFEILGMHVEKFIREDKKAFKDTNFNKKFGYFVERHVHLIAMISAIESSFTFIAMSQVCCMSVGVCCVGFQILGMFHNTGTEEESSILQVFALFSYLGTQMTFTFVQCLASENLAIRSSGIFHSIYNSKWYLLPNESIRYVTMMMFVSMKPRRLTGGKIFDLSLPAYCNITKSVAGYISMLIAVSSS